MLCEHCKKKMIIERELTTLFYRETHHICDLCYQKYPLFPSYTTIPIEKGVAHYHTMITRGKRIEPECYQSFLKVYYLDYLKHFRFATFIYEDVMDETLWQSLESFEFGDMYIVTLYENSHEKGEER